MKNGLDKYEEYVSENLGYNMIHIATKIAMS